MTKKTEKASVKAPNNAKKRNGYKPFRFFKEVYYELKKVTWPAKKELRSNTVTVIIVTLIAAVLIGLLDWGMSSLYHLIIRA